MTVHCPSCGRPNPDEAYICQFCDKPLVEYTPHQIAGETPEHIEPVHDESQDWLEALRQKKEEDAKILGEDYFNRYGSLNPADVIESEQKVESEPVPEKPNDLDSWMSQLSPDVERDLRLESGNDQAVEPDRVETPRLESANPPGWLENIREKIAADSADEEQEPGDTDQGGDWLTRLRKQTDQLNPDTVPKKNPEEESNPEWLDRVEAIQPIELFPVVTPEGDKFVNPFTEDLPEDFAQNVTPDDELNVFPDQPFAGLSDESEHPIPEALRNSLPQIEAGSLPEDTIPPEEELLKMTEGPREKISSTDIPSWLSNILGENEAEAPSLDAVQSTRADQVEGDQVEPGPLPNWVQAMRPVEINAREKTSQETTDKHVEEEGPLAGIRGILPGEAPALTYSAAVGYNISSEIQKPIAEKIALFNEMLKEETAETPIPGYRRIRAAGTVRWIVMVLMIAIMLYPILTGIAPLNLSNSIPVETGELFKQINGLGDGSKVLLVIDYEPAYAGEIEMASNAVMNQLMAKQANLYVISTNAAGATLGQKLIDDIATIPQSYHQPYTAREKFHILGFLPGGQAGIQALNTSLTNTIPLNIDLVKTTEIPGLSGPMPLRSFDGVLILSDQADTLRYWVEQAQQQDGKPGIWAVVSSQAAPMLKPYVRSGQIQGMVTGTYGGSLYERILQQPGLARLHWNTFQTGALAAIIFVIAGGILNYIGQLILRSRKQKSS